MMLGAVLAGGASRRFGSDKAERVLDGQPLWRRQVEVLAAAGADPVVLIQRPDQPPRPGTECWSDGTTGAGPLRGLRAALAPAAAPWVAVLAVDMPGIDAGWFQWLRGFCAPGVGAMARHPEACEPLAAIYPAEALGAVEARLAGGDLSLQGLARELAATGRLRLIPVTAERAERAKSLNTAAAFSAWQDRRGTAGPGPGPSPIASFP
jgi:molybdopterin-guanine dinucleotide biosynthesis protein A